jgi:hypothetical protein
MTLYQIEERMRDRQASFGTAVDLGRVRDLLDEALQVLAAAFLPTAGTAPQLGESLRRDIGLS